MLSKVKETFSKSTEIQPCSSLPLRLCNGSFYCKVEQFHLCLGWGRGVTAIIISGSCLYLKKAEDKGTLVDWHMVTGRLCNSNEREATTQEMTLHNRRGTFTQPTGRPSGKQGTLTVTGGGMEGGGLCWMFGVKVLGLNVEVCEKTDRWR